jgi:hypothetical protein
MSATLPPNGPNGPEQPPEPAEPQHPVAAPPDGADDAAPTPEARPPGLPRLQHPLRGRRLTRKADRPTSPLTPEQRLLVLDAWLRSGLPAADFAPLVGVSKYTLHAWKRNFQAEGPAGLTDAPRGGPSGSRLPEATRRAILLLKEAPPTGAANAWLPSCSADRHCPPAPRPSPASSTRPATNSRNRPPGLAPGGLRGPTPEEAWQGLQPVGLEERVAFAQSVERLEGEARAEQGYPVEGPLGRVAQAAVDRAAVRRALVAHRLLRFTSE